MTIVVFDIDGVVRDVGGSYRLALADTVDHFTDHAYRPTSEEIDQLKSEGLWNNDWDAAQELIYRYSESQGGSRAQVNLDYDTLVDFFQSHYLGPNRDHWTGYICSEPVLMTTDYLPNLTEAGISWGFFSGAGREEVLYVLEGKLGIQDAVLIAMADAPGKPNPTGLFLAVDRLSARDKLAPDTPVIYVGDTVADIYTVNQASLKAPARRWFAVGILPPHVQENASRNLAYTNSLKTAGATIVLPNVNQLTPSVIQSIISDS